MSEGQKDVNLALSAAEDFKELEKVIPPNTPVAPAHGIAAIALSMALKYHDIATVQDGVLYQQYKMEGRNMRDLHIDMVFETAIKIEIHLMGASDRIAKLIVDAIEFKIEDDRFEIVEDGPDRWVLFDKESGEETSPVFKTKEEAEAAKQAALPSAQGQHE
jgi:hypothetical protein